MKLELKEYQDTAAREVLRRLRAGRRTYREDQERSAFALSAMTGAGKTVIASAVLEALLYGNDEFEFARDETATVLWLTDSPSLNEQTRHRILTSSDKLLPSQLRVIRAGTPFAGRDLERRQVYFLNTQLLGKGKLLVRGAEGKDKQEPLFQRAAAPDAQEHTFWDILRNTIEGEDTTLYLILDEAHRGIGKGGSEDERGDSESNRSSIVNQIINGENDNPPVPVVWGISATIDRFSKAMEKAADRTTRPPVLIHPADVQREGLVKGLLRLDFPEATKGTDQVLLARGVQRTREFEMEWNAYTADQGHDLIAPLLVVQVANTPAEAEISKIVQTVRAGWPELSEGSVANVFGEHKDLNVNGWTVPYVKPELVQDRKHIRVLLAKEAISTGWDCPRAEVLVSFRPADDPTHITQVLGRIIRNPLARPVGGNASLNSVDCLLPFFDLSTTTKIAEYLRGEEIPEEGPAGPDVIIAPAEFLPNAHLKTKTDTESNENIVEAVWAAYDATPSQLLPLRNKKPLKRLSLVTKYLAQDGFEGNAVANGLTALFSRLDGIAAEHAEEVRAETERVLTVKGGTLSVSLVSDEIERGTFTADGDRSVAEAAFAEAKMKLSSALAMGYAEHLADQRDEEGDDDAALEEAELKVAALARIAAVVAAIDDRAETLSTQLLAQYDHEISGLQSDDRKLAYDNVRAMARKPQKIRMERPKSWFAATKDKNGDPFPTERDHLLADSNGDFPVGLLKTWEQDVLRTEMSRNDALAWFRNPVGSNRKDTFRVAYEHKDRWRGMHPDFLFFYGDESDVRVSVIDPHGHYLTDALPKLKGLADFAEEFGESFQRIASVAKTVDKGYRLLDLKRDDVREAIRTASTSATEAVDLYNDDKLSQAYVIAPD